MIRIRYSAEPYEEVELEGSSQDLFELGQAIIELVEKEILFPVETGFSPSPYQNCLNGLCLIKTDGLLCIAVRDQKLYISGNSEVFTLFAD